MKTVSCQQMRELDRRAIENYGIAGTILMDRAGMGLARAVERICSLTSRSNVILVAGHGNNGGDAFCAAGYLKEWGLNPRVWIVGKTDSIMGDALFYLEKINGLDIPILEIPDGGSWRMAEKSVPREYVLVDGILGTGTRGDVRGLPLTAVEYVNRMGQYSPVAAIDVPSGLDADTGTPLGTAVKADLTVTMGLPKKGLLEKEALDYVGALSVVDIGIPEELTSRITSPTELIASSDVSSFFKKRKRDTHKGTYGHLLIIGGAKGFAGAVALACKAALRSGVGLISALVPKGIAPTVTAIVPEAMIKPGGETKIGSLSAECLKGIKANEFDAVLIGPGLTDHNQSGILVKKLLSSCKVPLILDADALNACRDKPQIIKAAGCPTIITPHPGEMARLLKRKTGEIQDDRVNCARTAAEKTDSVVVLKGAGTIVTEKDGSTYINMTGNPGMATGGMGDVLGGVIGSLIARGVSPIDAAKASVYLHGLAGDNAAWKKGQTGITANDVIEELPLAIRETASAM